MASFLRKLVRNGNSNSTLFSRILLNYSNLQQIPYVPKPRGSYLIPDQSIPGAPVHSLGPGINESPKLSKTQQVVFPNSPFGFCLSPVVPSTGVEMSEEVEGGEDDGMMRADSVKKKRKRKMNKHKYKKLRKRLRRKAK